MPVFLALFLALVSPVQSSELSRLIQGVDQTFARMKDFSADFVQIFEDTLNQKQQETGHLYLKKPRMMRLEYKNPEEKLFVSDGKTVSFYVPADRQVSRESVGQAVDDRIPLMFLLGRSNLQNEFARIEMLDVKPMLAGDRVLRMYPRRKTEVNEVMIEVDPVGFLVRRLAFIYSDGQRNEFIFSNIRKDSALKSSVFDFSPPAGVEVLNGLGR